MPCSRQPTSANACFPWRSEPHNCAALLPNIGSYLRERAAMRGKTATVQRPSEFEQHSGSRRDTPMIGWRELSRELTHSPRSPLDNLRDVLVTPGRSAPSPQRAPVQRRHNAAKCATASPQAPDLFEDRLFGEVRFDMFAVSGQPITILDVADALTIALLVAQRVRGRSQALGRIGVGCSVQEGDELGPGATVQPIPV